MIRETFQPEFDEFISDLESYATGSYLSASDRVNWTEPFDPAAVTELREVLDRYLATLDALAAAGDGGAAPEALTAAAEHVTLAVNAINERHEGAVIEDEERETLWPLILRAAHAAGAADAVGDLSGVR